MALQHWDMVTPVPSTVFHNSTDVRSQYTRDAARQVRQALGAQLKTAARNIRHARVWPGRAMPGGQ